MKRQRTTIVKKPGTRELVLLFDIGNTHTHVGLARGSRIVRQENFPTPEWASPGARRWLGRFSGSAVIHAAALCSVVPQVTPLVRRAVKRLWGLSCFELSAKTLRGLGIDYPRPMTIGPDRLANAVAARRQFAAPVVVVDFGTAVTFDVVDRRGNYIGGIIAPGLAAMTEYLHEKTALLPRIKVREVRRAVGKSTEEAMRVGAVQGYRGLVRELIQQLKRELQAPRLPVVATGGYGRLIAARLPEIKAVEPLLTLKGLLLVWEAQRH